MKRFYLGLACILFLVGCGSKASNGSILECSSSNTIGSTLSDQNYKIYFNGEKVEKLSVDIKVSLSDSDDVTRDNLERDVSSAFDDYRNRDGVSYSSNIKDNGFNVVLDVDYNSLSDEDKASISLINSEKSYDDIKNELESDGFICK